MGNPVYWTCFTGAPITFTSLDFGSVRPVFDGGGVTHTWFAAEDRHGTQGKLYFRYLKVQNFSSALSFRRVGGNYRVTQEILGRCGWFNGPRVTCTGNVQH